MKEITYEEWIKNPTPRMMWVWDSNEKNKKQRKVIYLLKENITYPVIVLTHDDIDVCRYKHCAEIEEQRRMTNKELSRWLREKPTREIKYCSNTIGCFYTYNEEDTEQEAVKGILIREDDSDWREPLVEVEE